MKRISLFFLFVTFGCGTVGVTSVEQDLVKPTISPIGDTGANQCGLAPGGKARMYGVTVLDMPFESVARANATIFYGAAAFIGTCGQVEILRQASGLPYGANSVWGNNVAMKALKLAERANAMEEDTIKALAAGGSDSTPANLGTQQPTVQQQPAVAANFVASIIATKNYGELVGVLEYEASVNPNNTTLCRALSGKLREEIVKPKNDFEHDRDEVLKAFR